MVLDETTYVVQQHMVHKRKAITFIIFSSCERAPLWSTKLGPPNNNHCEANSRDLNSNSKQRVLNATLYVSCRRVWRLETIKHHFDALRLGNEKVSSPLHAHTCKGIPCVLRWTFNFKRGGQLVKLVFYVNFQNLSHLPNGHYGKFYNGRHTVRQRYTFIVSFRWQEGKPTYEGFQSD